MSVSYRVYKLDKKGKRVAKEEHNRIACFYTLRSDPYRREGDRKPLDVDEGTSVTYVCDCDGVSHDDTKRYCDFLMAIFGRDIIKIRVIKRGGRVFAIAKSIIFKGVFGKTILPLTAVRYLEEYQDLVRSFIKILDANKGITLAAAFKMFHELNIKAERRHGGGGHFLTDSYGESKEPISFKQFRKNLKDDEKLSVNSHFRK